MTAATDKELKALKEEFASLKSDVSEIGKSVSTLAKGSVEEGEERLKKMAQGGQDAFDKAARSSRRKLQSGWGAVEGEIEERPLTSLGIALGLGFLIGRILDR